MPNLAQPGDTPQLSGAAVATTLGEAAAPQDMDRAAGDDGGSAEPAEHCGLVRGLQQLFETKIWQCLWGSSDGEDAGLREPLTLAQLVAREDAERAKSLDHHDASPRPAKGPHGIDAVSGGHHELQLASETKETTATERALKDDARAFNTSGGTSGGAEFAVDLTTAVLQPDAAERKLRAIFRAVAASRPVAGEGLTWDNYYQKVREGGGGDPLTPKNYDPRLVQLVHNSPDTWSKLQADRARERQTTLLAKPLVQTGLRRELGGWCLATVHSECSPAWVRNGCAVDW